MHINELWLLFVRTVYIFKYNGLLKGVFSDSGLLYHIIIPDCTKFTSLRLNYGSYLKKKVS